MSHQDDPTGTWLAIAWVLAAIILLTCLAVQL